MVFQGMTNFLRLMCWASVLIVFAPSISAQSSPLELPGDPRFYEKIAGHADFFLDPSAELSVEQVIDEGAFQPIRTKYPAFGLGTFRVWLKLTVTNTSESDGTWRLDIARQYVEELNAYVVREGDVVETILQHSATQKFHDRPIINRFLLADFQLAAGETAEIYVGYTSSAATFMPVGVGAPDEVVRNHWDESNFNTALNGALIAMMIIAGVLSPIIGRNLSLAFILYIFAGTAYVFHADGYTFQHLWPSSPEYNDQLNLTFMLLMPVFGLHFSRVLFKLEEHSLRLNQFMIGLSLMLAVIAILSIPLYSVRSFMVFGYSLVPISVLIQLGVGIFALRKKLLGATAFLAGVSFVFISLAYATIAHLVPGHYNLDATLDVGHVALIAECIAFAAAILLRILGMRRQRDEAVTAELALAQEKLQLTTQLQKSQKDYIDARKLSDRRRDQLASVSHDLRQPLTALRGTLTRIGGDNEDVTNQMHAALDYLESLAREQMLADPPVGEAVATSDNIEAFSLNIILESIYEMFAEDAASKGIELRFRPTTLTAQTDPFALMRVISNLVSNAVHHSAKGGILLGVRRRAGKASIEVWDTGRGMSEDEMAQFLKRHERGDASEGSGLGLDIVQSLCKQHNYDFQLTSRSGKGTRASFTVPIVSN